MKNQRTQKLLALICALTMLFSLTLTAQASQTFTDVPSSHWASDQIQQCLEMGIVTGHGNGKFGPNDTVTGAQFATMLDRTFYSDQFTANSNDASLTTGQSWYYPALYTADSVNMLTGTSQLSSGSADGWKASAGLNLNRYDMAQMLYNVIAANGRTPDETALAQARSSVSDFSRIPSNYQPAVSACIAAGVITGMTDGTFSGSKSMTRAQSCVVVTRVLAALETAVTPPTTPSTEVKTPVTLKMNPTSLSLTVGSTGTVTATASGTASAPSITYTSSNQTIATVSGTTVTGKAAGTAVITAKMVVDGKTYTATCSVTVTAPAQTPEDLCAEVVRLVNIEREKQGLSPLGTFDALTAAAKIRAPELAKSFSHTRPDGTSCFTALKEANVTNYTGAGENIAAGYSSPAAVVDGWMNSPGHRANILNKSFTHIGVGYYTGNNWVQLFVTTTNPDDSSKKVTLTMSPKTLSLTADETGAVKATAAGVSSAPSITYASSNTGVATVDNTGKVTAKAAGTATITASATVQGKTYKDTCTVTVKAKPTQITVAMTPKTLALTVDESGAVKAAVTGAPTAPSIEYTSSNANVAAVDSTGKVTAKAAGTATITASVTVQGTTYKDTCTVTVKEKTVVEITVTPKTLELTVGETGLVKSSTNLFAGPSIVYTTSDESIVSVNRTGTVTAKSAGTAIVTASITVEGTTYSGECAVTVKEKPLQINVTISPAKLDLTVGETGTVRAAATGAPTAPTFTYNSNNPSVAEVSVDGVVTAKSAGYAVITAITKVGDQTYTATCNVTVEAPAAPAMSPEEMCAEVVRLVNIERANQGLSPLSTMSSLTAAAQTRASELASSFSHDRPNGTSCFTALDEAGVRYYTAGENIAAGYTTPAAVVEGWMNSPGHRANILNGDFTYIGVGYYTGNNWVQMFIG